MKKPTHDAIRSALVQLLSDIGKGGVPVAPQLEHHRTKSGWESSHVRKPSGLYLFRRYHKRIEQLSADVAAALAIDYPEHLRGVGTSMGFGMLSPDMVLLQLADEVLRRHGAPVISEDQLIALLADVSRFFEKDVAGLRVSAPVL